MKILLLTLFSFVLSVTFAQTVPVQQPVEQQYHINYWWWIIGVLLALGVGVLIYLMIKKDPKRDAVR